MDSKRVLGLVGGIGSGKSAVAAEFVQYGGHLINADRLGHDALRQPDIKRQVIARFGQDILDANGDIVRKKLGVKVFGDERELRALEAIVFPFIGERIRAEIDQAQKRDDVRFIILDAAVMLESGWSGVCDQVIFVDAPRDLRLERIRRQRGWSDADLQAREALQLPLEEKRRRADVVIDNRSTPAALADQVSSALRRFGID